MKISKRQHRARRHKRIKVKIKGSAKVPKVSVFRSNKHLFVQLVDDTTGRTLVSIHDVQTKRGRKYKNIPQVERKETRAALLGVILAQKAKEAGISKVVFDRGGYKYHGRVKALAEGLRKGGLKF